MPMGAYPLQPGFAASGQALRRQCRSAKAERQEHRRKVARLLDMHGKPLASCLEAKWQLVREFNTWMTIASARSM
jgi:hypothetical protein